MIILAQTRIVIPRIICLNFVGSVIGNGSPSVPEYSLSSKLEFTRDIGHLKIKCTQTGKIPVILESYWILRILLIFSEFLGF